MRHLIKMTWPFVLIMAVIAIIWNLSMAYFITGEFRFMGTTCMKHYNLPTASMEPTIMVGDRVLADKCGYDRASPAVGDVIAFRYPKNREVTYIKRIVAVAGDSINLNNDEFRRNNQLVEKNQVKDRTILDSIGDNPGNKILYTETLGQKKYFVMASTLDSRIETGAMQFKVPPDTVFVFGDNRGNSTDSRHWGAVGLEDIIGKVISVTWSMGTANGSDMPAFRWERFFTKIDRLDLYRP